MSNLYDDSRYGLLERHYFDQISGNMQADKDLVKRFYPKGPIYIKKFGVRHEATQGGTETLISFKIDGTSVATAVASTDSAPWAIASKAVNHRCSAGSYITISNEGSVATGTVQCFMDYVRKYADNWLYTG